MEICTHKIIDVKITEMWYYNTSIMKCSVFNRLANVVSIFLHMKCNVGILSSVFQYK